MAIERVEHAGKALDSQVVGLNEHRQHLWKICNRLQILPSIQELEKEKGKDNLGWDALMQVLFGTAYNLSMYGFAWTDTNRNHPSGVGEWTAADTDLKNGTVVVLNASGKTALAFAYALRQCRPKDHQPNSTIGVGSPKSIDMLNPTRLYDTVALNDAHVESKAAIETSTPNRIVLLNFGARPQSTQNWTNTLQASSVSCTLITIGTEVEPQDFETAAARMGNMATLNFANANVLREKGIEVGGQEYFEKFDAAWETSKKGVKGLRVEWGEGLVGSEGWEGGSEKLCRDEVRGVGG